jgi:hypothetical protein
MGKHLKKLLTSLGDALTLLPSPRGYRVERNGHRVDAANLRGDFARVGGDMRTVLKRDQQTYQRTRKG